MKKEDVKNFIKQHKWEIINGFISGALVGVSFYSGYLYCIKTNTIMSKGSVAERIISDAAVTYNKCSELGIGIHEWEGYIPAELGKLGEYMLRLGVGDKDAFTHFIAIGQPRE